MVSQRHGKFMSTTQSSEILYAVLIVDSCYDLGLTPEELGQELVCKRVGVYKNQGDQLMSFAETPCTWSECFEGTREQIQAKHKELQELCKDSKAFYEKYGDMM